MWRYRRSKNSTLKQNKQRKSCFQMFQIPSIGTMLDLCVLVYVSPLMDDLVCVDIVDQLLSPAIPFSWISGSSTATKTGVYGTINVPSATRFYSASWTNSEETLGFVFGGRGYTSSTSTLVAICGCGLEEVGELPVLRE
jgi:hypothetical protein